MWHVAMWRGSAWPPRLHWQQAAAAAAHTKLELPASSRFVTPLSLRRPRSTLEYVTLDRFPYNPPSTPPYLQTRF